MQFTRNWGQTRTNTLRQHCWRDQEPFQGRVPIENVGLVYAARVAMTQSTIQVEDKTVELSPGMNVSVEIKTGQRRLIEFFLSPLFRAGKEGLRERQPTVNDY